MADDMDDGVGPDINEEGGLGFVPQRRNLSNNLLPYADNLDSEIASQLTCIKTNLAQAVARSDIRYGVLHWTSQLQRYVKLYSYCFSKQDHIAFVKLYYELVLIPREDVWITLVLSQTLLLLLKKVSLITPDELELQWRPLYDLHNRLFHNALAYHHMLKLPAQCESTINSVIRSCKPYFAAGTTEELLQEFMPRLCPFDEQMNRSIKYLDMFLPVVKRQGGRPPNHHLWRGLLLSMLRYSPHWEPTALGLLARLAWKNIGTIDWEDELTLFFTKVLRSFRLPVGYKGMAAFMGRSYDTSNVALFIVANLGGGSIAQEQLTRLVDVVESYLHPSNVGNWTPTLMDLLNKITLYFNKRINRERRQSEEHSWELSIPAAKRLTEDDIDAFVDCLLPVTLTALFGRAGSSDASMVLGRLATLRTGTVLTKFLDLMYPALTSSSEPVRLQACLQAGVLTARSLVTGGSDFPAGPTHVLPLLRLLLPGIDPNDISKTMATFQLITTYTTLIPLVNCSTAPAQVDLTEMETELCQQSAELEDFLLVLLERCLTVVESCVSVQQQSSQHAALDNSQHAAMSKEETLLEAGLAFTIRSIFQQAHPSIAKVLVRRLSSYVIGRTLETGVSGRLLSNICRAAARSQPELLLRELVPPICRLLVSLTASESVQKEERPDNEIMFNLLILSEIMHRCDVVVQYVEPVKQVLRQCLTLVCVPAQQLAVSLLDNILSALTTCEPLEYKSITHSWDLPYSEFLPVRHWGSLIPGGWAGMKVQWIEPGPEQQRAVADLLNTFVLPELHRLDAAAKDLSTLTREQLQHSLHVVQESLNAGPFMELWDEPAVPLYGIVHQPMPPLTLAKQPLYVQFSAPGRPANVRQAIAQTILRLSEAMLDTDSDNTKAYSIIINILWSVGLLHSIKRTDFENRWRTLSQVQRLLRSNLVGAHQHWHRVRNVMVQRTYLQHLSRTLEAVEEMPYTGTHKAIMDNAFRLATSNYSQVRRGGQQLLRNLFGQFPGSYLQLMPAVLRNLALDTTDHHKLFKGTLYVLVDVKYKGVLGRRDWAGVQQLWPALLAAKHSEKPSIAYLLSHLLDNILKYTEMIAITQQMPASLASLSTRTAALLGVTVTPGTDEGAATALAQQASTNLAIYNTLVEEIASCLQSGKLQWRYEQIGIGMLGSLIRTDVPFPAVGVKCIMDSLTHHNTNVRKLGMYYLSNVLRNQKRPHVKRQVSPRDLQEGRLPSADLSPTGDKPIPLEQLLQPGMDRPDNSWLQYDPANVNLTEEQYNQRRFCHPTFLGFTSWPRTVTMYAPPSEQPPLNRSAEQLSAGEREVYEFFRCEERVSKWLEFLTLEDQKGGAERFDIRKMMVFKGLFRNFGPWMLSVLQPHLERISADVAEASQRCASEMVTGLVRATKHWPYSDWKAVMSLTTSLLSAALPKMSAEALDNWYRGIMRISMDRDANLMAPIIEMLVHFPDLSTTSSFILQCRLYLCASFLHQQEWRMMSTLQRVLDQLMPALSHPYKNVRDRISYLLFNVFCHGTGLFYDSASGIKISGFSPDLDGFVDTVLGELGSLQEYSGGGSDGGSKSSAALLAASSRLCDGGSAAGHHVLMVPGVEAMVTAHDVSPPSKVGADDTSTMDTRDDNDQIMEDPTQDPSSVFTQSSSSTPAGRGDRAEGVAGEATQLPSPSFDCVAGETDERKNAFRIINTMCSFIQIICSRNHYAAPTPLFKMLGALCQLESVDSEQEVCSNCVSALCMMGQTLVRQEDILPLLNRIREIAQYRWWRARSAALGVLQMIVFHNALTMMAEEGAASLILETVLDRLKDERLEVRNMASEVLSSLLHIAFVPDKDKIKNQFQKTLRRLLRGVSSSSSDAWPSERVVAVHGAVLGLSAFVKSAPYTVPPYLPEVLCTLANHINLPQPIAGSIRDSLSNFRRTHHDNWQEHKQHFSPDQLETLNDLLLSPSYYA